MKIRIFVLLAIMFSSVSVSAGMALNTKILLSMIAISSSLVSAMPGQECKCMCTTKKGVDPYVFTGTFFDGIFACLQNCNLRANGKYGYAGCVSASAYCQ